MHIFSKYAHVPVIILYKYLRLDTEGGEGNLNSHLQRPLFRPIVLSSEDVSQLPHLTDCYGSRNPNRAGSPLVIRRRS